MGLIDLKERKSGSPQENVLTRKVKIMRQSDILRARVSLYEPIKESGRQPTELRGAERQAAHMVTGGVAIEAASSYHAYPFH